MKYLCIKSIGRNQTKGKIYNCISEKNGWVTIIEDNKKSFNTYKFTENSFDSYFIKLNSFIPLCYYKLNQLFKN